MRFLRKITRLVKIFFWTLYTVLLCIPASCRKNKWETIKAMAHKVNFWSRGLLKICNISLEVHGNAEDAKGVLIVSNHTGYADILIHAAVFPIRFAPKAELKKQSDMLALLSLMS